jgi:type IV pilus assembly protein PilO
MMKNKLIYTVVIVGVICLVFFAIIYPPRRRELSRLNNECAELEKNLGMARESLKKFTRIQTEYDSLITTWARVKLLLPEEKDMPDLLEDIARVGRRWGVEIVQFKPQNPVPRELCTEIPISFDVCSGYHQLGGFLSEIANLPRLVKVRQLSISPCRKKGSENVTLKASFVGSAYTVKSDTTQARKK